MVKGLEYVKYASNVETGVEKLIVMGPFTSPATFVPECGGDSISFRDTPAVRTTALVNWQFGTSPATESPSVKLSKEIVAPPTAFGRTSLLPPGSPPPEIR